MSGNEAWLRELTMWRRIYEHQREEAKRDLAFAQENIERLDAEYARYFAIADTHAKRGDSTEIEAPSLMSGGGAEGNRT